jgi:hypothetical protein
MTKYQDQLPANAKPGQYARFNALGRFIGMDAYLTNGLGLIFQVQADRTLKRIFY